MDSTQKIDIFDAITTQETAVQFYNKWNEEVEAAVPKHKFLKFNTPLYQLSGESEKSTGEQPENDKFSPEITGFSPVSKYIDRRPEFTKNPSVKFFDPNFF